MLYVYLASDFTIYTAGIPPEDSLDPLVLDIGYIEPEAMTAICDILQDTVDLVLIQMKENPPINTFLTYKKDCN